MLFKCLLFQTVCQPCTRTYGTDFVGGNGHLVAVVKLALQCPSKSIVYFAVRNKERHSRAAYRECRPCGGCRGKRHPGESVTKQRNVSFRSLQSDCNGDFVRQQPTESRCVRTPLHVWSDLSCWKPVLRHLVNKKHQETNTAISTT